MKPKAARRAWWALNIRDRLAEGIEEENAEARLPTMEGEKEVVAHAAMCGMEARTATTTTLRALFILCWEERRGRL